MLAEMLQVKRSVSASVSLKCRLRGATCSTSGITRARVYVATGYSGILVVIQSGQSDARVQGCSHFLHSQRILAFGIHGFH